jgi:ATP phosphoribosyltransferase
MLEMHAALGSIQLEKSDIRVTQMQSLIADTLQYNECRLVITLAKKRNHNDMHNTQQLLLQAVTKTPNITPRYM